MKPNLPPPSPEYSEGFAAGSALAKTFDSTTTFRYLADAEQFIKNTMRDQNPYEGEQSIEWRAGFSDGYEEPLMVRAEAVLAQEDAARDS